MAVDVQVYELLAQALIYPDVAFADRIWARVHALSTPAQWATALLQALDGVGLDELQSEHIRLFVNAYGGAPCLPYESVFAEGRVMGETAGEVAAVYAEWGIEEAGELPDHAAVELAFAAQLARLRLLPAAAKSFDALREAQEVFEREHLLRWLPALGAELQAAAELLFYRVAGSALAAVFGAAKSAGAPDDPSWDLAE